MLRCFRGARERPHALQSKGYNIFQSLKVTFATTTSRIVGTRIFNARDWIDKVAPSLHTFLAQKKHLLVPNKFKVPHGDPQWPQKAWGYRLGLYCKMLRARRSSGKSLPLFALEELEALGFPWTMWQYKWDLLVLPSLIRFREINGHCDVPWNFVVPEGDNAWPKCLWGLKLGYLVRGIKHSNTYRAQVERSHEILMDIGFSTQRWDTRMWDNKIFPALKAFKREFGHCNVPNYFIVPNESPWPEATRGLRLGKVIINIHSVGNYERMTSRDKEKLKELGVVWSQFDDRWTNRILPALRTFRQLHQSGWVPASFVVPHEEPWPKASYGLRLGNTFRNVRYYDAFSSYVERDREQLNEIKIDFKVDMKSAR
ncbi:hypothetical protein CCR75_003933 [Bremia lactucae]|uniref:Helicase-associated domain-containing protein n=1 Tax=Bremia lactucae TaxID=4779 RepID=A0A976IF24_BRELC|nr:hypothetical protein CCR75_003933 [Bremia lactucae]